MTGKSTRAAEITEAVATLPIADADAFLAVTVTLNAHGEPVPTMTVVTPKVSREIEAELRGHLQAFFDTLRKAYAPKEVV